jgi:hypothetical protein
VVANTTVWPGGPEQRSPEFAPALDPVEPFIDGQTLDVVHGVTDDTHVDASIVMSSIVMCFKQRLDVRGGARLLFAPSPSVGARGHANR